jgi:hypothetical protein
MDESGQHPPDGGEHAHWKLGPEYGRRGEQLLPPRRLLPRQGFRTLLPVIQHLLQGDSMIFFRTACFEDMWRVAILYLEMHQKFASLFHVVPGTNQRYKNLHRRILFLKPYTAYLFSPF